MGFKLPIFKRNNVATLIPGSNVGRVLRSGVDLVGRWFHGRLKSRSSEGQAGQGKG